MVKFTLQADAPCFLKEDKRAVVMPTLKKMCEDICTKKESVLIYINSKVAEETSLC